MNCPTCGSENRAGARFCVRCGTALSRQCASCGASYIEGDAFCAECGSPLQAVTAGPRSAVGVRSDLQTTAPAARTERRHVSVLFTDLVGFTSLSRQRDAEDVRDLLDRYASTARTIVARYGGTIEKFIGDAVMAVWGLHGVHENDAERAVRAGLDLVDAVKHFGDEVNLQGLTARAGVLTGEAVVNLDASSDAMLAGDLVNTASRVQTAAEPGTVFIGEPTLRSCDSSIECVEAGTFQLKGIAEPMRLWRALRVIAGVGGALRPTALEPPFVGRDRELRLLKELLHSSSEEGAARLVSIIGQAGVGKSRLAWELFKYVDGLSEEIYWHRGRCLSYGEGVAYWALAEMVRMRAGIVEGEPVEEAKEKLRRCTTTFVPSGEDRQWVEPRLAHLLGLDEGLSADPSDLFAAWRYFFERMALQDLTVLVFEDLQWADQGLLDFIEYLLEWSRDSRILVITLARPELLERRQAWGSGKRGFTSLYLEPLSLESMNQLLNGLVPGLKRDVRSRIAERAAGIPLYAVETVRMLLDRGLVVEEHGRYQALDALDSLEVPETLHALIAARLDGLSAFERQLLQDAAVLGKSFSTGALAAVSGVDVQEMSPALATLVAKDLLAIQSDPRSPERGQYVFVQDLVRSVAHGTLPRKERKTRHLAAAEYLSSSWSEEDEITEVVAAHLVEAYEADPDAADAAGIKARAYDALVRAAEHAESLGAWASALQYCEQAIALAGDESSRARLHMMAGKAARVLTLASRYHTHVANARDLYRAIGDRAGEAIALAELGSAAWDEGEPTRAKELCQEALAIVDSAPGQGAAFEAAVARVAADLARFQFFNGESEAALKNVERALDLAETIRAWEPLCKGIDTKACILAANGRRFEAEVLFRAVNAAAMEHGLVRPRVSVVSGLATLLEEDERLEAALEMYREGEEVSQRLADRRGAVGHRVSCILILFELGRWDEAAQVIDEFMQDDAGELASYVWPTGPAITAVWLHLGRGNVEEARAHVRRSAALLEGAHLEMRSIFVAAEAAVANAEGDPKTALRLAEPVIRAALEQSYPVGMRWALYEAANAAFVLGDETKIRELQQLVRQHYRPDAQPGVDAHFLSWDARIAAAHGDVSSAESLFKRALDAFTQLSRPFWLAVTRLELAQMLQKQHRQDEALLQIGQARDTFMRLGAKPWLERVDSLAPSPEVSTVPA